MCFVFPRFRHDTYGIFRGGRSNADGVSKTPQTDNVEFLEKFYLGQNLATKNASSRI
jgi:hypothetical protein